MHPSKSINSSGTFSSPTKKKQQQQTNQTSTTPKNNKQEDGETSSTALVPVQATTSPRGKLVPQSTQQQQQMTFSSPTSQLLRQMPSQKTDIPTLSCWPTRPTVSRTAATGNSWSSTNNNNNSNIMKNGNQYNFQANVSPRQKRSDKLLLSVLRSENNQVDLQDNNDDNNADNNNNDKNNTEEQQPQSQSSSSMELVAVSSPSLATAVASLANTSSKPALVVQLEKDLSVKLSSKKSLPEKVTVVNDLLKKFAKMFPSYQSVLHAAIKVVESFSEELSQEVDSARKVAASSVRDFQRSEKKDVEKLLSLESEKRIALEAEVKTLKEVLNKKIHERENEVQVAHAETMKMIRRTNDETHMEDEVRRLRLHVGKLASECAKLKLKVHSYEYEKSKIESGAGATFVRDFRETVPPQFIEASRLELEKCRMVMQREIVDCASGTNSAFRLKISHLQNEVEELQAKLKESQLQKEFAEKLAYERRYVRGTLPLDVFDALKRDSLARPDEPLPRLRDEGALGPQEMMRREELSSIGSCYTPRPFIPFDVQTVLGISLNERSRDVVEQLAVVAVDLHEELTEMRKNNRKLFAAARWMSTQELDSIFDQAESEETQNVGLAKLNLERQQLWARSSRKMIDGANNATSSVRREEVDSTNALDDNNQNGDSNNNNNNNNVTKPNPVVPPTPILPSLMSKMTSSSSVSMMLNQSMSSMTNPQQSHHHSYAASSSNFFQPINTSGKIDGIIPTFRESEWSSIPHFLRTDVTLGIVSKNWSSQETLVFTVQIMNLIENEATERARRLKDKFTIKPPADLLTERRRSPLIPPLDATNTSMIQGRGFVPIGYAVTVALRLLAEKQLTYEWEQGVIASNISNTNNNNNNNTYQSESLFDQQSSSNTNQFLNQSMMTTGGADQSMMSANPAMSVHLGISVMMNESRRNNTNASNNNNNANNNNNNQQQHRKVSNSAIVRLATNYAYNWWESLHRYQEAEPLCRLALKIVDGSQSIDTFKFFKMFMSELHHDLEASATGETTTNNGTTSFEEKDDDKEDPSSPSSSSSAIKKTTTMRMVTWPVLAKAIAWRFSGSSIENLSRKAVFAAAKTVDFLKLSFADHLPISKMLSMHVLQLHEDDANDDDEIEDQRNRDNKKRGKKGICFPVAPRNTNNNDDGTNVQEYYTLSPLVKSLLSILLEANDDLFDQVYRKLEPALKLSTFAEGVVVLNVGAALQLAKEMDANHLIARNNDFTQKLHENIAASGELIKKRNAKAPSASKRGEGVSFAEALEETEDVNDVISGGKKNSNNNQSTANELMPNASNNLAFSARQFVRSALVLCQKLDDAVHKPRRSSKFGGGDEDANTNNNDNKSSGKQQGSHKKRKRSNSIRKTTAAAGGGGGGGTLGDTLGGSTDGAEEGSGEFVRTSTMALNEMMGPSTNSNNNNNEEDNRSNNNTSPNSNKQKKKRSPRHKKKNAMKQQGGDDDDDDGIFSSSGGGKDSSPSAFFLPDDDDDENDDRNDKTHSAGAASSRELNELAAKTQTLNDKDWVEWHDFISKLRRIAPKPFSAEELQLHQM